MTLARYEDDERMPDADFLAEAARVLNVDLGWLMTEKGDSPANWVGEPPAAFRRDQASGAPPSMVAVPMLDVRASAGSGQVAESELVVDHVLLPRAYLLLHGIHPDGARIAAAEGDSMYPDISDGDLIVFDVKDVELRDKIFMFRRAGQLLIKKLQRRSDGTIALLSANPAYAPEILPRDDVDSLDIIGRVGLVLRSV